MGQSTAINQNLSGPMKQSKLDFPHPQPEDAVGSGILYQPGPASWLSNPAFFILLPKLFSLSPETTQLQDTKTKEQGVYQASNRLLPVKPPTNMLGI